jgi:hypothetical protein
MASGAPTPGGPSAPAPGGLTAPKAGGHDMKDETLRKIARHATAAYAPAATSAAGTTAISKTVEVHKGGSAVSSYAWTLVTKPASSTTIISGSASAQTVATDALSHVGLYVLRCVVTFDDGSAHTVDAAHTRTS